MTLRRFVAVMGFCFMLVAAALVVHIFILIWISGQDHIVLYVNTFQERTLELWLVFVGFCLVPFTIYEFDDLLRNE